MTPEDRLAELGLILPEPPASLAAYVPAVRFESVLYVSGQLPLVDGALLCTGRLGEDVSDDQGRKAAQRCALNALSVVRAQLGELSRVRQVAKVTVFVAATPGFTGHPAVANGASELLGALFGEAGRHARSAVGVAGLPLGAPVELDMVVGIA